jgi:signal transduction histidine kinase
MDDFESPIPQLGDQRTATGNVELADGESARYVLLRVQPIHEIADEEEEEEDGEEEEDVLFNIPETVNAETATVTIFIARSREEFDQMLGIIYLTIGGIDLFVLAGIYLVVRNSVQRGLQPIVDINAQIAKIDPDDLEERVSLEDPPNELSTIIHTLNDLLDRMDQVITRERRFTSDVAHELRTPVSELRTACEVGKLSPEDTESTELFFEDIHDIARQMEKVVSNLLSLSRWDQEKATVTTEEVKLNSLVQDCWEHFSEEAEAKGVKLDCRIDPETTLTTDREKFEMLVQNLLENAIAYCVPESRIRCHVEPGNPTIHLFFENQATNLCKEDLAHLFDRFWRKEKARSEVNHSGLGLSIVKALADILEIEVHPELMDDQWFRMRLKIRI